MDGMSECIDSERDLVRSERCPRDGCGGSECVPRFLELQFCLWDMEEEGMYVQNINRREFH